MIETVSADTDDLDSFVEHGDSLQNPLKSVLTTLGMQRNHLLGIGLRRVVDHSEITTLDNTMILMADLDGFVGDISTALKRSGVDRGNGVYEASAFTIERRLDGTEDARFDAIEQALIDEGLSPEEANRIRRGIEAAAEGNPRFEVDGATLSEPGDLAAAVVAQNNRGVEELISSNTKRSGGRNPKTTVQIGALAEDLYYGQLPDGITSYELLDAELRSQLTDEQYQRLQDRLAELDQNVTVANLSLLSQDGGEVEFDGDRKDIEAEAMALFDGNHRTVGGRNGRGESRSLDEPEIVYQLQKIAEQDPGRALLVKLQLESMMTPEQRTEFNRLIATNGSFGDGINVAFRHPRDGIEGGLKGWWNNGFAWWSEPLLDLQVTVANGLYGLGTNSQVPRTWQENAEIVDAEFSMDNIGQQGGADVIVIAEVVTGVYGLGKGGMTLVRIGGRYFLRKGDDLVAEVGPSLARQLDESGALVPVLDETADGIGTFRLTPRQARGVEFDDYGTPIGVDPDTVFQSTNTSANPILRDRRIQQEMAEAWKDSVDQFTAREQGGWIVRNPDGSYGVERWPPGATDGIGSPPRPENAVGGFHTHPNRGRGWKPGPSEADIDWVLEDPTIRAPHYVMSHDGVFAIDAYGGVTELG